jgi:amino acid adenylation domain-containing protein
MSDLKGSTDAASTVTASAGASGPDAAPGARGPRTNAPPARACVHRLFEAQAARTPGHVALLSGTDHVSYEELNTRANKVAHYLRGRGVGPERTVGLCLRRSTEMMTGLLGVLKAGGAYVPVDPTYPRERRELILDESGARVLLTQSGLADESRGGTRKVVRLDADWSEIEKESGSNPEGEARPGNLAYVIYTSGSTGRPKGVMVQHDSLAGYTLHAADAYGLRPGERALQFASLSFDASAEEIYPSLASGATLVLRNDEMLGSAATFLRQCQDWGVTVLNLPTAYWHELARRMDAEELSPPASLRLVIIGGERALPERLAVWLKRVGRGVRLVNTYGPTEATIVATSCELTTHRADSDAPHEVPIGSAVREASTYVLDESLTPVADGEVGELHIGGEVLARGYLGAPGLTAGRFIPDPFVARAGGRLYRTGDLVRVTPDGMLEFQGRADGQVKVRGYRIELGEIEAALRGVSSVREAVVLAREDTPGDKRLVAYVVAEEGRGLTAGQLRDHLKATLPGYMVPAFFKLLDGLPLTPGGKVDRHALPPPDQGRPELDEEFVGPRTDLEKRLAKLWSEVLELEGIGVHDNFFELGGDSLRAAQLLARVRAEFQVEVSALAIFSSPTVAELAQSVEAAGEAGEASRLPPIRPVPRDRPLPVSFPQQVVWLLGQMTVENLAYSTQLSVRLTGKLDKAALDAALTEIVRRHEIFRTTFETFESQPAQMIQPPWRVCVPVTDIGSIPADRREAEAERLVQEECLRPFDIKRLPLIRWSLLRLSEEDHVLIQVEHHLVHDGWSLALLMRELKTLYEAFCQNRPSPLPELPIQFADYAAWQRQWLRGEVLEGLLAFWKKRLAGCPPLLELPSDRPRPKVQSFRGAALLVELPPPLCKALRSLSRRRGVTLFMTMLAAFETLLCRYTGQDDLVIGSSVANRRLSETEQLIGMIVNTVVLRTDLSGNPSFLQLLERVRRSALETYEHQDLPFEKLVEELQPDRELSYNPLFQVMFNFHDSRLPELDFGELKGVLQYRQNRSSKFDLNIVVIPRFARGDGLDPADADERLLIEWEYSTDLFDEATMRRMFGHYRTLLEGAVEQPERRILDLPMLTEEERRQLLGGWNRARAPRGGERSSAPEEKIFAAPRTPVEEKLAGLWREALGVERVGRGDDFFALGGRPAMLTRLLPRMSEAFGVELSVGEFFSAPTVAALSEAIGRRRAEREEEERAEVLRLLSSLSEEEAEAELHRRQ